MRLDIASLVARGPLIAAVAVAWLGGLVSFLSPCVLPLAPAYLSYVTGLVGADLTAGRRRGRVLAGTALFMTGFASVFVSVSVLAVKIGLLWSNPRGVQIVSGLLIIGLGLALLGLLPGAGRRWGARRLPTAGLVGAPLFGAIFALSWTPCVGPTLAAVLALAAAGGSTPRAILLATAYCAGLWLPFAALGLGLGRLLGAIGWIRRHGALVTRTGGVMLVIVGLAMATGAWDGLTRSLLTVLGAGAEPA